MPRPNRDRTIEGEANLARRVRMEREARGLSYEALAKRMTDVGCPTHGSALHKIEKADPPRRITVNELVALADVFELSVEDLLTPAAVLQAKRGREVVRKMGQAEKQLAEAVRGLTDAYLDYFMIAVPDPELREFVDLQQHVGEAVDQAVAVVTRADADGQRTPVDVDHEPMRQGVLKLMMGVIDVTAAVAFQAFGIEGE